MLVGSDAFRLHRAGYGLAFGWLLAIYLMSIRCLLAGYQQAMACQLDVY